MTSDIRIVKRYSNRKLYDTERSCYVTLEDLAVLIREGEEIKIIDNKTAEDLTSVTLAQIIFETEKKSNFMPLPLLRGLIQDSGDMVKVLAKEGMGAVQQKAFGMRDSAQKVTRGLGEKFTGLARQVANLDEEFASENVAPNSGHKARNPVAKELILTSKQSFERLQKSVEELIKGPLGNMARFASLGRDMEDIRQRIVGLEDRVNSLPQDASDDAVLSAQTEELQQEGE